MTNTEILRQYRTKLAQINNAIKDLAHDKRAKAVALHNKFVEMRENVLASIECLEYSIKMGEI